MAMTFPDAPTLNQEHTVNNIKYKWDGSKWVSFSNADTFTGPQGPQGDPGITVSSTPPASPTLNQLWLQI